jgi:GNAT superfamily N-acetyltransferase
MEKRALKKTELDELLELFSYLHESDCPLPDRLVVEAVWHEIQDSPNFHCYGVFMNGKLVSSCSLTIVPNLSRGCRPYGVIENVVTHLDFRGKGFGSAVLRLALENAWSNHCYKVMLLTGRKSEAVYRFYESVGFDRHAKQAFLAKPKA